MRLHTMTININRDHRKPSQFVFGRYYVITNSKSFTNLMNNMARRTRLDKKGRILCFGRPHYDVALQNRIYIVKMGHDNLLWSNTYPIYEEIFKRLSINI